MGIAGPSSARRRAYLRGLHLDHLLADDVLSLLDHGDPVRVGVLGVEVLRRPGEVGRIAVKLLSHRRLFRFPSRSVTPAPPREVCSGHEGARGHREDPREECSTRCLRRRATRCERNGGEDALMGVFPHEAIFVWRAVRKNRGRTIGRVEKDELARRASVWTTRSRCDNETSCVVTSTRAPQATGTLKSRWRARDTPSRSPCWP